MHEGTVGIYHGLFQHDHVPNESSSSFSVDAACMAMPIADTLAMEGRSWSCTTGQRSMTVRSDRVDTWRHVYAS
eukprot:1626508-Amphidinium_carterae.3